MRSRVARISFIAFTIATASCAPRDAETPEAATNHASPTATDVVERGRYLVTLGACNECHTPFAMGPQGPAPDMTRMLSGHPSSLEPPPPPAMTDGFWITAGNMTNTAFAGPWGITFAPNLTPHETGLGVWTEEMFIQSIREGKHMGTGRPILPPMPWPAYSQMTDADLHAMFMYLQSIPPIENAAPQAKIAPPPPAAAGTG